MRGSGLRDVDVGGPERGEQCACHGENDAEGETAPGQDQRVPCDALLEGVTHAQPMKTPMTVPTAAPRVPTRSASSLIMRVTLERSRPIARRIPISLPRSSTDMARVLAIPRAAITRAMLNRA